MIPHPAPPTKSVPAAALPGSVAATRVPPGHGRRHLFRAAWCGLVAWASTAAAAPTITTQPVSQLISAGGNAAFSLGVGSTSGTTYQWQVSTDRGSTFTNVPTTSPYSGSTAATLNITAATAVMNGYLYRCNATNSGTVTSSAATLRVATPLAAGGDAKSATLAVNQSLLYAVTLPAGGAGARFALNTSGSGSADLYIQRAAPPDLSTYLKASTGQAIDTLFLTPGEASADTYYVLVNRPQSEAGTPAMTLTYTSAHATDLAWDPGTTDTGTQVFTVPTSNTGGVYYFKLTTQSTTVSAWRTALRVASGTADVYLRQNEAPTCYDGLKVKRRKGVVWDYMGGGRSLCFLRLVTLPGVAGAASAPPRSCLRPET